jgi:hypothetical protein
MNKKLPPDAFEYYFALGPERSYERVAKHFGVSKRAVTKRAKRDDWQGRANAIERKARDRSDRKAVETRAEMDDRHVQLLRAVMVKGLQALKNHSLDSAMEAVRALEASIRLERLIRGQPTGREELNIAEVIRRQAQEWMVDEDPPREGDEVPKATE